MRLGMDKGKCSENIIRKKKRGGGTPKKPLKLQGRDRTRDTDFGVIHSTHIFEWGIQLTAAVISTVMKLREHLTKETTILEDQEMQE